MKQQKLLVEGNRPLLLNDPQRVWLIESGSIALFAVKIKEGIPDGARRYVFSLEAGDVLFGMEANSETYSLLATSLETATVRELNYKALEQRSRGAGEQESRGAGEQRSRGAEEQRGEGDKRKISHEQLTMNNELIGHAHKWIEKFSIFPNVVTVSIRL